MDVHVPAPITRALLRLGVDVKTAQEDGTTKLPDDELLDHNRKKRSKRRVEGVFRLPRSAFTSACSSMR